MTEWKLRALCVAYVPRGRRESNDIFHPSGNQVEIKRKRDAAFSVCSKCPVVKECALEALAKDEMQGVRAGLTMDPGPGSPRILTKLRLCRKAGVPPQPPYVSAHDAEELAAMQAEMHESRSLLGGSK